jgi:ribosomal protein S18 acetylase RimI-like enzyme
LVFCVLGLDMDDVRIVSLTSENYASIGCPCFLSPKHEAHMAKLGWLKERFIEGFSVKLLFVGSDKKPVGFIEYVPGEFAWRSVDASGYLFIHCVWVSPNKYREKGFGSCLVDECVKDAKVQGKSGVAVITSDDSFMADKGLFLKNGFEVIAVDDHFNLLVKSLKKGPLPKFRDWHKQLTKYSGLNIVYSKQCPWVIRSIGEMRELAEKHALSLKITELASAKEAQNAPSVYATFTLINDGKIFADHYISSTRFLNILKKELNMLK